MTDVTNVTDPVDAGAVRAKAGDPLFLYRRMSVLGLNPVDWARFDADLIEDLRWNCAHCQSRQQCADDLEDHVDDPTWPGWRNYCPNAAKLSVLVALQYF